MFMDCQRKEVQGNLFNNMDENNETIPTWKIFIWLGIGFFAAIVIWFIIDTCYNCIVE